MKSVARALLTGMVALIALPAVLVSASQAASADEAVATVQTVESGVAVWTATNCDRRQEQFTIDLGDHAMYHRYQGTPGGAYTGWLSLGGTFIGHVVPWVLNADCRLEVFGVGTNHAVYHKYQTRPGAGPWSAGWASLGGWLQVEPFATGVFPDRHAWIAGVGSNGATDRNEQTRPSAGPWTGWVRI